MTERELMEKIYGAVIEVKGDVSDIKVRLDVLETDMKEVKADISELKADVSELKKDVSELKADVSVLKAEMAEVKADISELKADVSVLKAEMAEVKNRLDVVEETSRDTAERMKNVEITLETQVKFGISVIAEGHLDLIRKLDEALRVCHEIEMDRLRIGILETDVSILKNKVAAMA